MAPAVAESYDSTKSIKCSIASRKVRVIGKIRGFTIRESESHSEPWIKVKKHPEGELSEKCTVLFETQSTSRKETNELDCCYEHNEDMVVIYSKEVKPLVSASFDGQNASIIGFGPRGSGKTYLIQGCREKPGLAVMAMSDILSEAEKLQKSVSVSLYELMHDQAYDLLSPSNQMVQVLADAQGKINFKGLSCVNVTSISEFNNLYFSQGGLQSTQKGAADQWRKHKGLMICISSKDVSPKANKMSKINFIDLAGYEDPRKNNRDGIKLADGNRANKSLCALLNVVSAINANDVRVPYRESKLTRILQDSLGGTSHVLLFACLNPLFCQDTLSCMNLISCSYRSTKEVLVDTTNRTPSAVKSKVFSSLKSGKPMSASLSLNKQIGSLSSKHSKGRKLFSEEKAVSPKQLISSSEDSSPQKTKIHSNVSLFLREGPQDISISEGSVVPVEDISFGGTESQSVSKLQSTSQQDINLGGIELQSDSKQQITSHSSMLNDELTPIMKQVCSPDDIYHRTTSVPNSGLIDRHFGVPFFFSNNAGCDNIPKSEITSPPVSERIRQISNKMKSLITTPLSIDISEKKMQSCEEVVSTDVVEPNTPCMQQPNGTVCMGTVEPKTPCIQTSNTHCTPRAAFSNRSSRMKDSLVQDYLTFLNSANKEELKSIKGIGEKRASKILQLRDDSPEHFKDLDDLHDIGLSSNQIKTMMKNVAGELFN